MGLADELEKLQELRQEGVLTEEEFRQAKQKLLEDDDEQAAAAPPPPQTIKLSLKEGVDEIVDEESTLGQAANRYVDYKTTTTIVGAIIFIIALIVFAMIFSSAQRNFNRGFEGFPGGTSWNIGR